MCGIAGILSLGAPLRPAERELARAMTAALAHRGPDSAGFVFDELAALGNARLRVTDPDPAADLPMSLPGGRCLVYNGAVTNHKKLAQGLDRAGGPLRTASDAEVVLRLCAEKGAACLPDLDGHFACCYYDAPAGRAWLARDRHGLRPLFYLEHAGRLYFASEIKALLEVPGWDRRLDQAALWHFFTLAYIPGRATPFAAIRELAAGHLLEIDLRSGTCAERKFGGLVYAPDESITEAAAASALRARLLDAVERNLAVDAPAGSALSGGLDTGGLVGLAKELGLAGRLHTFSIAMQEPSFDESRWQRLMAGWAGTRHHEIKVGPAETLEALYATAAHLDEPSGDGAAVPSFLLAREAGRHVKVLLNGEGGDEVFNAYETHRAWRARGVYRLLPALLRALLRGAAARLPVSENKLSFDFVAKRFTEGAELGVPEAHLYWRHALTEEGKASLLNFPSPRPDTPGLFREFYDALPYPAELDRLSQLDLWYYFVDDLMVKNDRTAMAYSVESRFPYLDRGVTEYAASLPAALRQGLGGRRIQKLALRGLLPPAILRRQNMGLEMPHSAWFFGEFRALGEKYFARDRVERSGLLRWEAVDALWREHLARRRDNGRALWCVINFQLWFDLFVYDGNYRDFLVRPAARS